MIKRQRAVTLVMALCFGGAAFAADWPPPPTPLPEPLKRHVQRFVDSTQTRNYQGSPVRTYRALERTKYNEGNDSFYLVLGNSYWKYNASDLLTGGRSLSRVTRPADGSGGGELYLQGAATYDKDSANSGWDGHADGQFFLKDFDFDDRGYHYLAYSTFGWGILKENGNKFALTWYLNGATSPDQTCPLGSCPKYTNVVAVKSNGKYYAFVGGPATWGLWDVDNPSSPRYIRSVSLNGYVARTPDWSRFAVLGATVRLLTAQQIVSGDTGTPVVLPGNTANVLAGAFNDGAFWLLPQSGSTFYKVTPTGVVTSFPVNGSTLDFTWAAAGSDYIAGGNLNDMRVYKVNPNSIDEASALVPFKESHYPRNADISQKHLLPVERSGKTYFIWSAYSLGDVYEVQAGDSLSVARSNAASPGTTNPNAPANTSGNPFYGDLVTFSATFNGATTPSAIRWSPDYPSVAFGSSEALGAPFTVRYSGTATATKTVRAEDVSRPDVFGETTVTVQRPKARVKVPGVSTPVESSQSAGKVLTGASFFDASDGVVEGHLSDWSLDDGTVSNGESPLTGFGAGECGARTLTFAAKYEGFNPPAISLSYTVQPIIAKAAIGASDADSITFVNQSTYGTGFQVVPVWTETWELVDAANDVVRTQASNPVGLGTVSPFVVLKDEISTGYKVRLRMSVDVDIAPTGCDSLLSDEAVIPLAKPDPSIVRTLCQDPTTAAGSCTLSVASQSGASTAGWSYQWYLNSTQVSASATYSPTFPSASNHTIRVVATNPFGTAEDSETFAVTTPPCAGAPPDGLISFNWVLLGGRTYQFGPTAHQYDFQECDTFLWTFGNEGTSTQKEPQHTFSQDGSYSVTLRVTNTNGSESVTLSVQVGTVTPPPPPPPPSTCPDPRNQVFVNFRGSQSGCGPGIFTPPCHVGESVQFSIDPKPGFTLQSCHTQLWQFGSGASPGSSNARTAAATYSTVGTRNVTLTVSNGSVQANTSISVTTENPVCGATAPSALRINYAGLTSGCFPGGTVPCKEGEAFRFSIVPDGSYTMAGCETVAWNLGDGTTSNSKNPFNHTFPGIGPYTVSLNVTNSHGSFPTSTTVRFFDPNVPKPVVTVSPVSTKAKIGATINFVANIATGAQHPLVAIDWRIIRTNSGNEVVYTTSNTGQVAYTFNELGDFRVEVTATNAGGVSTPGVALVSVAEVQEYAYLIPVVAHLPGNNGTQWRTDLQIFNTDPLMGPIEFEFQFKGGVAPITKTIVMSSSTAIYEDFLAKLSEPFPSLEDAGPVIVLARGDSPPQMWSRTYTVDASGVGSYGQFIPAISLDASQETEDQNATYVLPGLEISERFRTNVGIVNPNAQSATVTVMARDDSALGFPIGSFDIQVAPFALVQIGDLVNRIPGIEVGAPFSLNVRTLGNVPIVVYGSMIDQLSNDPIYITGVRDIDQEGEGKKVQILPGAGRLEQSNGTWRSDIVVYNDDLLPIRFDLQYFDTSGTKRAEAVDQPLGPGAFVRVVDVLKWDELDTDPGDSFGLIKVETKETVNRYPIVFERTYKDRGGLGSFGQGIPAISPDEANVRVGQPAFLAGVRSDESYYTNLGLVAVGNEPSTVRVTLLHDGSGSPVGTWEYVVDGQPAAINPNASLIVTNIIRAISPLANRGTLKIEVVSGGDVWAYASVIAAADPTCGCSRDEHTFDPEYIPAVRMPIP